MYKVFLVDDEKIILDEVKKSVPWMDNGFEVIGTETNPFSALEKIIELQPHVVFSDLKMPVMNGHEFIKKIREEGLKTEVVMLSAYGTFEDAKTFYNQNGFYYLLKPIQQEEVQIVLEKLAFKLSGKYGKILNQERMSPSFLELLTFINEHYNEKISLDGLGKRFGLSPGYICNLFSKHLNSTLTCYITDIRMKKAVEAMCAGYSSLKKVAIDCGYSDYYYFSKVFKDYYGVAPSQYQL